MLNNAAKELKTISDIINMKKFANTKGFFFIYCINNLLRQIFNDALDILHVGL